MELYNAAERERGAEGFSLFMFKAWMSPSAASIGRTAFKGGPPQNVVTPDSL